MSHERRIPKHPFEREPGFPGGPEKRGPPIIPQREVADLGSKCLNFLNSELKASGNVVADFPTALQNYADAMRKAGKKDALENIYGFLKERRKPELALKALRDAAEDKGAAGTFSAYYVALENCTPEQYRKARGDCKADGARGGNVESYALAVVLGKDEYERARQDCAKDKAEFGKVHDYAFYAGIDVEDYKARLLALRLKEPGARPFDEKRE